MAEPILPMTVSPLHALTSRRSMKFLRAPAPKQEELDQILQAAMSAPDHGKLRPWRFVLIRGAALGRLADRALDAVKRRGDPRQIGRESCRERVCKYG